MAIPGLKPSYDVRAKVRVGKKSERGLPTSVDYFICDDPDFVRVVGEGKKELRIFLPYQDPADCFRTGLEQWQGQMLVCYAKGDEQDGTPFALRKASMKKGGQEVNLLRDFRILSDTPYGQDRRRVECASRDCPMMKSKACKPMGRLDFWIDGIGRDGGVYRIETKSWHGVENIERTLLSIPDPRGIPFVLRVSFTQLGDKRFPELTLEAEVEVNNDADVALADALIQLDKAVQATAGTIDASILRQPLAAVLDLTNPGWRENGTITAWVQEQGLREASKAMLKRHLT